MKILIVSNLYPPESRGGAEMIARDVAQEAVVQGHEVMVLSTSARATRDHVLGDDAGDRDELFFDEVVNGVTLRRFCPRLPYHILDDAEQSISSRLLWHTRDLVGSRATTGTVAEAIKDAEPDLIITFNLRGMEIGSVARAIHKSRVTWIHEIHDVQLLVPSGLEWFGPQKRADLRWLWQSRIVKSIYSFITEYIMGSPDIVVSPSVFMITAHKSAGLFTRSKTRVQINPVDLESVKALAMSKSHERDSLVLVKDHAYTVKLLYVGQLELHKGVHDLLDALKHVGEHKVELDIVGAGSELDELMNQASGLPDSVVVRFHGKVAHKKVLEFMANASSLVVPSVVVENCPGVILEARSVGLPVIASHVGGIPELINQDGLFEPANPRGIVEKIHMVAEGKIPPSGTDGLVSVSEYVKSLLNTR